MRKKNSTIRSWSTAMLLVDQLKQKNLLETTADGVFFIFPELFVGPTPEMVAKNLYLYARSTNLIKKDQVLYFKDLGQDGRPLFAQYDLIHGFVKI